MKLDWKKTVSAIAPTLGAALGGPLGGAAVHTLLGALGIDDASDPEHAIAQSLHNASPEMIAALKQADHDFRVRMKELDIDLEQLHAADRASARERERHAVGYANPVLASVVMLGFFTCVGFVLLHGFDGINPTTMGLAGTLVGYVSAKADQVIAYYFGSSVSSARKTELMVKQG